jgi:drug/metabolite transporter (DMT)-like permease
MKKCRVASLYAILAAALYAIGIPCSKLLLRHVQPTMLAVALYLGAGLGLALYALGRKAVCGHPAPEPLRRADLPYTIAMVALDIAAPILMMLGVSLVSASSASLLGNFEIVATSLIAFLVFGEVITRRLWLSIALITAASILLTFEGGGFTFHPGSLLVLSACVCWGLENNCTRKLSGRDPIQIVTIKGCFSGLGSLLVALCVRERLPDFRWLVPAMLLGFVAYGLSISLYILAQKELGAAKTSAYYSLAPFLGVLFGVLALGERPGLRFYLALAVMAAAVALLSRDTAVLRHIHGHSHVHTHEHAHGDLVHTHEHEHLHSHSHDARGLGHVHPAADLSNHSHSHTLCV